MLASPVKIMHLITTLDTGGAEMMLYKLLANMNRENFSNFVVSLAPPGAVGEKIKSLGIPVFDLSMRKGRIAINAPYKLIRILFFWKPLILQTWLYHADLLGLCTAKLARVPHVVWNVRCSNMDLSKYSRLTQYTVDLCVMLSSLPDAIITNSHSAKNYHLKLGYKPKRFEVIPNGFDLQTFRPNPLSRAKIRKELRIPGDSFCIGHVARFDPMKDHRTFFNAVKRVITKNPNIHVIMCGEGVDHSNLMINRWIKKLELPEEIHLLGRRDDIPDLINACDMLVSSSRTESFPNVIGEAMSCGLPCVMTDVGDAFRIMGKAGTVVPRNSAEALSEAIIEVMRMPEPIRMKQGNAARERIRSCFSIEQVVRDYENLYFDLSNICAN